MSPPNIQRVTEDIYRISIPIPVPLKHVNSYALKGPHGWTLFDCGFHDQNTEELWHEAFRLLGIAANDIEQIVVSHLHPDHYGCSGWLQQLTGAPVRMGELEVDRADYVWGEDRRVVEDCEVLYQRHGLPGFHAATLRKEHERTRGIHCDPHPVIQPIVHGSILNMGGRDFIALHTPGHTDGLLVFWHERNGILLANDLILEDISPNINYWPNMNPDPLGSMLESWKRVRDLPAVYVLPGHRNQIADLAKRVDELHAHHEERLLICERLIRTLDGLDGQPGASAWQVTLRLFGDQNNPFGIRFALSESIAHLEHLVVQEKLRKIERPSAIRYLPY